MASGQARWRSGAGVGLLAVSSLLIPHVEANHPGTSPIMPRPAPTMLILGSGGQPVRVVVSVLAREPGPWPITLRAMGGAAVVPTGPKIDPAFLLDPPPAPPISPPGSDKSPPGERSFHLLVGGDPGNPGQYRRVGGRLVAWGQMIQIYADADDPPNPGLAHDLLETYERVILPRCESWIGCPRDVDGDGRLTVLLSKRVGELGGDGEPVIGCVRPADFQERMPEPFGNRCDLITLDSRLEVGPHSRTVLAHEYAHAVIAGRKGFRPDGSSDGAAEEDWLDEALAHEVEARLGLSRSNLDHRVAAFRRSPERYGLVIADYQAAGLCRSAGHRGAAFEFLDYCARRYGPGLIARLACSAEIGEASLERASGRTLDRLFVGWAREEAGRTAEVTDRIRVDDLGTSWMAYGTTFHVVEVDTGRSAGVRFEVEAPPGVRVSVDVVEPHRAIGPATRLP